MNGSQTGGIASCIYEGRIRHRRMVPVRREFEYRIFMVYLDLAEIPEVMKIHPLWSTRRRSPARFRRADFLGPAGKPLKEAVEDLVEGRTGVRPEGSVRMLTHLRYWGTCFNPVTFYYCFNRQGDQVKTVLAEVTNTPWGEQHIYLADRPGPGSTLRAEVAKRMHVSPLMDMDHRYELIFGRPGPTIPVHMESRRRGELHFDATLRMERKEITRGLLGRLLFTRLPMPAKVLGGIHLEAARTWLAGATYHPHPVTNSEKDLPDRAQEGKLCPVGEPAAFRLSERKPQD